MININGSFRLQTKLFLYSGRYQETKSFLSGIHTVMTFALKKQKRLCRRTVLCGQQTGFTSVEENSLVMTFASESGFATMLWSKHFATQNGLLSKFCYAKPPTASAVFAVFDRPVFFGVHTLRFIVLIQTSDKPHLKNVALFYILKRFIVLYRIL